MNDKTRLIPDEQRVLGSFEVQCRNLLAVEVHARRVLNALEGRYPALVADLRERMDLCDLNALLDAVTRLRSATDSQ